MFGYTNMEWLTSRYTAVLLHSNSKNREKKTPVSLKIRESDEKIRKDFFR